MPWMGPDERSTSLPSMRIASPRRVTARIESQSLPRLRQSHRPGVRFASGRGASCGSESRPASAITRQRQARRKVVLQMCFLDGGRREQLHARRRLRRCIPCTCPASGRKSARGRPAARRARTATRRRSRRSLPVDGERHGHWPRSAPHQSVLRLRAPAFTRLRRRRSAEPSRSFAHRSSFHWARYSSASRSPRSTSLAASMRSMNVGGQRQADLVLIIFGDGSARGLPASRGFCRWPSVASILRGRDPAR